MNRATSKLHIVALLFGHFGVCGISFAQPLLDEQDSFKHLFQGSSLDGRRAPTTTIQRLPGCFQSPTTSPLNSYRVDRTNFLQPVGPESIGPERVPSTVTPSTTSPAGATPIPTGPNRLNLLPGIPDELKTSEAVGTDNKYGQFVERTVDPEQRLAVLINRPRILVFKETPKRIYLPNDQIATYDVVSATEIAIYGKKVGSTVLTIWVTDPNDMQKLQRLSYLVEVVADPEQKKHMEKVYEALEKEINQAFPDSMVRLSLVGDQIVVRGQAKDAVESAQITRIISLNAPRIQRDVQAQRQQAVQQTVNLAGGGFLNQPQANPAPIGNQASNIINLLRIPGEQQVMLRVTVAEVQRSAARTIGLDFSVANSGGATVFSSLVGGLLSSGGNLPALLDNGQVQVAIKALRNLSLARTLAEPTLTTLNGKPASFQAGGQFPVPVVTGFTSSGLQGVDFVPFGVQLQFTPFIVDRDKVRLTVSASVSTRDTSIGTSVGGGAVSGLNSRTFQTTVELRDSQTLAVAGLIQTNFGATSDRVPLWGDLPLLNRLGGAADGTTAGEQELIILITPELVAPLEQHERPSLPGQGVFEPGDVEFYLKGRLESRRSEDFRSPVRTDIDRIRRYRRCEDMFIIGPQGRSYGSFGSAAPAVISTPAAIEPTFAPIEGQRVFPPPTPAEEPDWDASLLPDRPR